MKNERKKILPFMFSAGPYFKKHAILFCMLKMVYK